MSFFFQKYDASVLCIQLFHDRVYWRHFINKVLNLVYLQGVLFIASLSTPALSHITHSSSGIFRESCRAQDQNKRSILYKSKGFINQPMNWRATYRDGISLLDILMENAVF